MIDFATLRADRPALEQALRDGGCEIKGSAVKCGYHEDKTSSGGIFQGDDGAYLYKCNASCCGVNGDVIEIRARNEGITNKEMCARLAKENGGGSRPSAAQLQSRLRGAETKPPEIDTGGIPVEQETEADIKTYTFEELKSTINWLAGIEDQGKLADTYTYTNPATKKIDAIKFRIEHAKGKTFKMASPFGDKFVMKKPQEPWPIYSRTRILSAGIVLVCEGEKAALALHNIFKGNPKIAVTTGFGGAGTASQHDWTPLAGKVVYLWPDNDPPNPVKQSNGKPHPSPGRRTGLEHMRDVAIILASMAVPAKEVYWLDCDAMNIKPKGDAYDLIKDMRDDGAEDAAIVQTVQEYMARAEKLWPSESVVENIDRMFRQKQTRRAVTEQISDIVAGRRVTAPLPWRMISRATKALLPCTITLIVGTPGATKSFAALQTTDLLLQEKVPTALLELEDGAAFHIRRSEAQIIGDSRVVDDDWIKSNEQEYNALKIQYDDRIRAMEGAICELPDKVQPNCESLLQWLEQKARAGYRMLLIDPISMMVPSGNDKWPNHHSFMVNAKGIIKTHKCSLILVTHLRRPPPGMKQASLEMSDIAFGAVYERTSQTILLLTSQPWTQVSIQTGAGIVADNINRNFTVLKARNGRGVENTAYGAVFNVKSLTLEERGIIVDD